MSKNQFGTNLRLIREQKGWTQAKAAEEISKILPCEVTENRYKNWELGRCEPTINLLMLIAEVFAIDDLYLFIMKPIRIKKIKHGT